jgi:SAM-dependent methyltransferase
VSSPQDFEREQVQGVQTRHRVNLAHSWDLKTGTKILEIGCGQGDMTSVIAHSIGPEGRIVAVDIASADYGAPQTLREATDLIKASAVGRQIEFRFEFDIQDPANAFGPKEFDSVVLAHSSWYVSSGEELGRILRFVRPFAHRLLFAEWDLEPQLFEQLPHLLAILIQGQVEAFKSASHGNVRTPLHKSLVRTLIEEAGWVIDREGSIDANEMQDADWEIRESLSLPLDGAGSVPLPEKAIDFLRTQQALLRGIALPSKNFSLPAYSLSAH